MSPLKLKKFLMKQASPLLIRDPRCITRGIETIGSIILDLESTWLGAQNRLLTPILLRRIITSTLMSLTTKMRTLGSL